MCTLVLSRRKLLDIAILGLLWFALIGVNECIFVLSGCIKLNNQPPYGGLLSSSCGELQASTSSQGPFAPKGDFSGRTDG